MSRGIVCITVTACVLRVKVFFVKGEVFSSRDRLLGSFFFFFFNVSVSIEEKSLLPLLKQCNIS